MFSKLALRNVRRSFRDYGVYLLTLTFGVCLFYTFNSIDGQGVMVYLAQSQNPMAQLIQTILDIFSVFVAVVLACLILYANTFLIRRRKRELGTYLLLGLSQRQVSGLLVLETLVIGLISLAAGLLLGLAASQGLSALTLSMFSIRVDAFALAFSPRAAVRTVGYFGLIFLLVMVFSGIQVSRARLIDLMQGERKNEELRERPLGLAVVQFVLGAVCLAAAYAILLTFGMAIAVAVLPICAAMLFLGTLGTLLIFKLPVRLCGEAGPEPARALLPGAEPIHPAPVAEQGPLHLPVHDGHLHPAAAGRRHHRQLHRTQLHLGGGGR